MRTTYQNECRAHNRIAFFVAISVIAFHASGCGELLGNEPVYRIVYSESDGGGCAGKQFADGTTTRSCEDTEHLDTIPYREGMFSGEG